MKYRIYGAEEIQNKYMFKENIVIYSKKYHELIRLLALPKKMYTSSTSATSTVHRSTVLVPSIVTFPRVEVTALFSVCRYSFQTAPATFTDKVRAPLMPARSNPGEKTSHSDVRVSCSTPVHHYFNVRS